MRTRKSLITASCFTVLGLLMASCAPAAAPTPTPKPAVAPAATATIAAPSTPKPAAPSATATAAAPATPKPAAPSTTPTPGSTAAANYKDASYEIEGRVITLANGVSEIEAAPGSASKIVTRYFGNEATGDLNGDGTPDVAFLLTQSPGGSGTFFYVVVALKTKDGYVGTNAVLLGDRIAPQTTELRDGSLIVNYADRKPGEAMTTRPSVGVSKYLKVVDGKLTVVPR